jgi:hypothetical protein
MSTKLDRFPKKFFNSEMLKASGPRVLEIKQERLQSVTDVNTGEPAEKSVLSFVNTDIQLVLNVTNWDSIVYITGSSDSEDWPGQKIELYADKTRMGAKQVDGVRVRAPSGRQPALTAAAASPPAPSANKQSAFAPSSPPADKQSAFASAAASPSSPPADEGAAMDDEIPF